MGTDQIRKIRKKMEKTLDPKRYEHTLGVAYTASALAMRYQEDMNKALVAGLLHDCAKCMDNEKKLHICQKHHIPVTDIEKKNPYLLHAKVGRHVAKKQFHIHDKDILNAILNHTTGRPGMSPLEKIVFIADYIEPNREKFEGLEEARRLAYLDLDMAMRYILEETIAFVKQRGRLLHPLSLEALEYYKNR